MKGEASGEVLLLGDLVPGEEAVECDEDGVLVDGVGSDDEESDMFAESFRNGFGF